MATLTAGEVTFLDDSIHNANPESITLASPGEKYATIIIPEGLEDKLKGAAKKRPLFGGKTYPVKNGKTLQTMQLPGTVNSRTELGYLIRYFKLQQEINSEKGYVCIKYATNDYYPFYDDADSTVCKIAECVLDELTIAGTETNAIITEYEVSMKLTVIFR